MKLSVIIPAYNEEENISICLLSLNEQTYKDKEVIVVDDGSTDLTLNCLKFFKEVKVLQQEHKGTAEARNLGAKHAKGEILVFIDADMDLPANYLELLINPIIKKDEVGSTHEFEIVKKHNTPWSRLWGTLRVSPEDAENVKVFRAIRKDRFNEIGGFNKKYGYADDQSLFKISLINPEVAKESFCYHKNPETLKETYNHAIWIGKSWKARFSYSNKITSVIIYPLLPLLAIPKALIPVQQTNFFNRLIFYFIKFAGYAKGNILSNYKNEVEK